MTTPSFQRPAAEASWPAPPFPHLGSSRWAVRSRRHRQRWWYSDGIWLDVGATGDIVGFAWTHWLADRGVVVPGVELDEQYAVRLQRDTQRLQGIPERHESGANIDACARVLMSRGLVEQCYTFRKFDSVLDALLERGPVVAGMTWQREMWEPQIVDGWTVCRAKPDGRVVGSTAVLLNAISLDLTLDGVTGFVRLKNAWGRGWGDDGQTLLSISDLEARMDLEASLLPIPEALALRQGVRQDAATEEGVTGWGGGGVGGGTAVTAAEGDGQPGGSASGAGPRDVRFEQTSIAGDQSTRRDTLGAAAYAQAIARGIQHRETKAPLTIGIKAPWGAGKTSLMRMIRDRLEWPGLEGSSETLRPIKLTPGAAKLVATTPRKSAVRGPGDLGEVTNQGVLRKLRDDADSPLKAAPGRVGHRGGEAAQDEERWRPTVWFNPWMYQTGDQVWAGLANEIINQVTDRMSRREREHFWLHLNRRRVDEQAVRRKIYSLVLGRVVPYAVFGIVLFAAGIALLATGAAGWLGGSFTAAGPAAVLAGGGIAAWQALHARVSTSLSGLVQPATAARRVTASELAGSYSELVASPDYRAQSGYLYLVHTDVKRVLDLVASEERPLVIFVDDLDRCAPSTVVQVIEAINIFLAGDFTNCIFVIAMEPEMVAAHIEAAYANLVQKLETTSGRATSAPTLGWRFLEKIVQLPLALPAMEPKTGTAFITSLFPADMAHAPGAGPAKEPPGDLEGTAPPEEAPSEEALRTATLSEAVTIAGAVRPEAAGEQVRRAIERRLTVADPEVMLVVEYASDFLNRNPREIKRFVNLFRFYTMVYAERKLANLPAPASLFEVAKIAVLGIRWPSLLGTLGQTVREDGEQTIFELLEGGDYTKNAAVRDALESAGLTDSTIASLLNPELALFLNSEPIVGAGVRGYI